jgi:hypothetical protein
MPRFELWRFRFRDPLSGRWIRARYRAPREDLDQRYGAGRYQTFGPPEVRDVAADAGYSYFNPARRDPTSTGNVGAIIAAVRPTECRRLAVVGIAQ